MGYRDNEKMPFKFSKFYILLKYGKKKSHVLYEYFVFMGSFLLPNNNQLFISPHKQNVYGTPCSHKGVSSPLYSGIMVYAPFGKSLYISILVF